MFLKIGQRPDHAFDEPLGLLSDCHRRIEHFLAVLTTLADRSRGGALSASERAQLEAALGYFATAAPRHTADEEQSLFPRLAQAKDPTPAGVLEVMRRLERDHDEADAHHAVVDRLVRRWLADNRLDEAGCTELCECLARLNAMYEAHIGVEDRELFPAAARTLSADELQAIGREMAARRRDGA